ncbi:sensor histidine kinase [Candidatus Odyssella thessalonicensis]|uniref:sensor histidine kinase n=1 Tax=Candidatus Odyssella thessalonicensis TaxID=84647 RepID=UPI000225B1FC|nr:HAMP domain-containing sensor histidine kinase [Candidatus Odyssella thessalonicensis]
MSLTNKFLKFLNRRVEGFGGAQYKTFGIFGVINYPLGYYILHLLGADESVIARLCAALISFPLIFTKRWPIQFKKYLNLYWFLTLLYCLPIFTTYTLLKNQLSNEWLLNFSIGLFILFLIVDYVLLIILYVVGILLGYLLFIFTGQEVVFQHGLPTNFMYIYGAMIVLGCIFSRNKGILEKERLQTMKMVAGTVAHEMRTPLAAIEAAAEGLKMHLPTLIETQKAAQEEGRTQSSLSKNKLQLLAEIPDEIKGTARSAFTVIDMLLMNLKEDVSEAAFEKCSILHCVQTALHDYSLRDEDKELITVEIEQDFEFYAHPLTFKHVLFNLLKNALYYIKAANKGKITIWTEKGEKVNRLYFEDTGKGISEDYLPYIFDQFSTRTSHGTGVGLAFCRMVMTKLGGDITCESVEGEYTRFILTFPALTEDKPPY